MPFRIIVASEHVSVIRTVTGVLRLLSMSCVITLTTTLTEQMIEHLHEPEANLLILGFPRPHARSAIQRARACRPKLRVIWIGDTDGSLPEADSTLSQPYTALRLIDAVTKTLRK